MRVESPLPPDEACAAMMDALEAEGVYITQTDPLLQGQIVTTHRGHVRTRRLIVTIAASSSGSLVTVNGQRKAYIAGRHAARSLR